MSQKNTTNRVLASAAAIAIAASGFSGLATAANAQDNVKPTYDLVLTNNGPLASTFPADGTSNLTIHKKVNPENFGTPDGKGQAQNNTPGDQAGKGYTFTLTRVATGEQLKNQNVFNELAKISQTQDRTVVSRVNANETLQSAGVTANPNGAAAYTLNTNAQGEATETGITNGVYLVQETASPDDTTSKVHPFLVFLPQPDPQAVPKTTADAQDWNDNVHVYPKNGRTNINKTVIDKDKNVGDAVEYTLSATVPASAQNETLRKFNLRDIFNSDELGDFSVLESTIQHKDGSTEKVEVTQGNATATDESTRGGNTAIEYTVPTENLKPGDVVSIKVSATLKDTRKDSEIINEAKTVVRHSGDDADHVTKPVEVITYVGNINLTKFSDLDGNNERDNATEEALAGATFELYRTRAAAEARAKNIDGDAPTGENAPVKTGTTDENGNLSFTGLHVNDFVNNADVSEFNGYFLVETKAPEGFVLPSADKNVREITLTKEDNTAAAGQPMIISNQTDIPNVPNERVMPQLPGTGENGIIVLGVLAFLLLGGAGVYAATRSRKTA